MQKTRENAPSAGAFKYPYGRMCLGIMDTYVSIIPLTHLSLTHEVKQTKLGHFVCLCV